VRAEALVVRPEVRRRIVKANNPLSGNKMSGKLQISSPQFCYMKCEIYVCTVL
jgi:hypothetical protein